MSQKIKFILLLLFKYRYLNPTHFFTIFFISLSDFLLQKLEEKICIKINNKENTQHVVSRRWHIT